MAKRIGILTAGSDSPGINAAIRAVGKTLISDHQVTLTGFHDGFEGLVEDQYTVIESGMLSNILTAGGTFLGSSSSLPHAMSADGVTVNRVDEAVAVYKKHKLDALICIGGYETQESSAHLAAAGLNVMTLPKAIDNDVRGTDDTIGLDTALGIAAEAVDRLHSTAHSHHRIIIVEIMGHHAGWLTLGAGLAGGADVILIPEIAYDVEKIAAAILERAKAGKRFSIVAVAEGATSVEHAAFYERSRQANEQTRNGQDKVVVDAELRRLETRASKGNTLLLANRLEKMTGLETRVTILGYLLRGGTPSAGDRLLATHLGTACADAVRMGNYNHLVGTRGDDIIFTPIAEAASGHKPVPLDHAWLTSARHVGTCLGD